MEKHLQNNVKALYLSELQRVNNKYNGRRNVHNSIERAISKQVKRFFSMQIFNFSLIDSLFLSHLNHSLDYSFKRKVIKTMFISAEPSFYFYE